MASAIAFATVPGLGLSVAFAPCCVVFAGVFLCPPGLILYAAGALRLVRGVRYSSTSTTPCGRAGFFLYPYPTFGLYLGSLQAALYFLVALVFLGGLRGPVSTLYGLSCHPGLRFPPWTLWDVSPHQARLLRHLHLRLDLYFGARFGTVSSFASSAS